MANKLTLNLTKTEFMLVASGRVRKLSSFPEIPSFSKLNEHPVKQVSTSAKSLMCTSTKT